MSDRVNWTTVNRTSANRTTANWPTANWPTVNQATANWPGANQATANRTTTNPATANRATAHPATAHPAAPHPATVNRATAHPAAPHPATVNRHVANPADGRRGRAGAVPAPPDDGAAGNRLLVLIVFWAAFLTSVAVWWFNTPVASITDPGAVLTAVGRITGMIGGFLLLVQVLMMSRVAWLEEWIGAHDLLRWHRRLGAYLLVAVLVHLASTVVGYALADRVSVGRETWTMLTTYEDMISAFLATGILVLVAMLAIRAVRRRMRYELWHLIHLTSYLVVLLAYGHQFAVGADLQAGFGPWYWTGLHLFVITCLLWGRVVQPLALNLRHRLRVAQVIWESADMYSVYIEGRHLNRLEVRAGQYFRWRFVAPRCWGQAHPFSLSASPNGRWLRLTVSVVGDHTDRLWQLRPGTRVLAEGPSGTFTAVRRKRRRALLIAGGSGIAPIRSLAEDMPAGTVLIYRASTRDDLIFRRELDWLARHRGIDVWYVLGSRADPVPRRIFSPAGMRELVPDVARRDVYLCGPDGLVRTAVRALRHIRVPPGQIHLDPFEF